ncbi:somatomedin-B and thrombospondin type-1 domain-containing protein-like [Carassius auratus]|uniref:Somatomedin-B and thrombospondin type-1 domain-containing protein-like n=1 Tax=Carassius auratus TaxID=7957 RepID=A0A6P6K990_CARAU|nr:somatomedin-B and thrombospondin type-1 domain-containing protein-like [Carassius auratus]
MLLPPGKMTSDFSHDYDLACRAATMSEWSMCSCCLEPCKPTIRTRQRQVIQEARDESVPCPSLHRTAGCVEYHDQHGPCLQSLVPALLTKVDYGSARKKRKIFDNITGQPVGRGISSSDCRNLKISGHFDTFLALFPIQDKELAFCHI